MGSYKCAAILAIAICLCFFNLASSLDTIIKGKKECPEANHNTTDDLRRVLKGGGGVSVAARSFSGGARSFSGAAQSSSGGHAYSSESGGYSSSSTIPAGTVAAGAAAAGASSNSNHHSKKNSSSICMGSDFLAITLLAVVLSSFAILSKVSWV